MRIGWHNGRVRAWASVAAWCAAVVVSGCSQPAVAPDLASDVPQERILGLAAAMRERDAEAIPEYVTMLRSDDPAVRMFAIGALRDLTGESFGYDYGAPEADCAEAVERWEQWVEERNAESREEGAAGL